MWFLAALGASHFAMVGFPLDTSGEQAFSSDLSRYIQVCTPEQLSPDKLVCVISDKSGAELWIGLTKKGEGAVQLETANPAFIGSGSTKIFVTADASDPDWLPYEHRVQAQFATGEAPIILDLADPREAAQFVPDARLDVDITAFADELSNYESEAAYYDSQKIEKIKFASNHFIPSGMFNEGLDEKKFPTAHALLAGSVLRAERRQNVVGKGSYWWALVETFDGAKINVVVDAEALKSEPKVGSILSGSFWLSAPLAKH